MALRLIEQDQRSTGQHSCQEVSNQANLARSADTENSKKIRMRLVSLSHFEYWHIHNTLQSARDQWTRRDEWDRPYEWDLRASATIRHDRKTQSK